MGKNLIQQARGKGSPTYRALSFKYKGNVSFPKYSSTPLTGKIVDIIHCPGHSGPLAKISYENGETVLLQAPEGIKVGDTIQVGSNIKPEVGNVLPLKDIPEGTLVFNIEATPGDGGKFVRASGTAAKIITKLHNKVIILLPSNKRREFHPNCRACIGVVAGGGRTEKPFLKAGNKYYKMKAKNKYWPRTSGVSMNAVDHPFGGTRSSHRGRPTQALRNAPPGRKVGKIAPKRTGRKKK